MAPSAYLVVRKHGNLAFRVNHQKYSEEFQSKSGVFKTAVRVINEQRRDVNEVNLIRLADYAHGSVPYSGDSVQAAGLF